MTRRLIQIDSIMDSIGIDNVVTAEILKTYFMSTQKIKGIVEPD